MRRGVILAGALLAGPALVAGPAAAADPGPMYGAPVAPAKPKPKPKPKPATRKPRPAPAPRAIAAAPTARLAWTARVLMPVTGRTQASRTAPRGPRVSPYAPHDGGPQQLLVLGAKAGRRIGVWYRVLLPSRPNGAAAWVPARAVRVASTPWRVVVDLGDRRATLFRAARPAGSWAVGVGTPANPTPAGRFAISEVIRQPDPSGFYGPFILTLTAHSTTLSDFDGGGGRVALHGTSRPDLLGGRVSHGCVRMPNRAIAAIARVAPPGTPVEVRP